MSWIREPNAEPIPGYRLIEPLGSGGFGEVWKCEAPGGLFKAMKFVYGNLDSLDVDSVRAEQEWNAMQRIKEIRHPFICSLERMEKIQGEVVIVMELADKSLHDLYLECQNAGMIGIPRDDLLRYLRDAAEALDFMNEKYKLQHLDIKPRNLFLISDRVKVADFGLVKHLERQSSSGLLGGVTPLYAPPETFNGKISFTCDQYSLAIVYQELLTGQRPFAGKNVRQLAQQHLKEEPELRALPESERPIVGRCLAKDPTRRYPNCMAFIRALYTARHPARVLAPGAEPALAGKVGRPKSMADTMEDFSLEGDHHDPSADVDLGAPPPPPHERESEPSGEMGMTVAQPATGALRPTLILGLGSFGRKALLELRCRLLDRFGDLGKLPLMRFLCIDIDPEAINTAVRGAPEVAFARSEVYPLPLQPVGNYRRMLDHLNEWLPREKLYAMPRSLQTQGSRALGRLAFVNHHQRLLARLRKEIQEVTSQDAIFQSATQTGLAPRDSTPRVYVIAAAGGGSSGLLPDLGYALRRLLQQMRHPDAELTALLSCSAPNDPATPRTEQANVYATLTELNHFADPSIPFVAQYGADGQRIVDQGAPFGSVYLLPLAHRSPDALEQTVSHLGSYLFHELTTPLGLRLDHLRHENLGDSHGAPLAGVTTLFRSFGTYAVWFPRGLLLRLAARRACRRLVEGWVATGEQVGAAAGAPVYKVCDQLLAQPLLQPLAICQRLELTPAGHALSELGGTPGEALAALLTTVEEQSHQTVAYEDPGNWARQASTRVRDWVGASGELTQDNNSEWRKTKLQRVLLSAAHKLSEEWEQTLSAGMLGVMEQPGARLAAAEAALTRLQEFCQNQAQEQLERCQQQAAKSEQACHQLELSLEECLTGGGGFRLFGGRSNRKMLRTFVERLTAFARQRLAEENAGACRHFYLGLAGRLGDRLRDMNFCRQRLRHLQEYLESPVYTGDAEELANTRAGELTMSKSPLPSTESYYDAIRQSQTARVVLPDAEQELERAALRFLQRISPDQWTQLDKELHERVLLPRGGLHAACIHSGDLMRTLVGPLLDETVTQLGQFLPIMDVAQLLGKEVGVSTEQGSSPHLADPDELRAQVRMYLDRAVPLLSGKHDQHQLLLLTPASNAGKALGEACAHVLPDLKVVRVPGQSDLMFCREQAWLNAHDLDAVLRNCRQAYEAANGTPVTSPHARFDLLDWLPLDP
jgi:serine/threonine protein kinase